jgi:hypothetical protein
MISSETQLKILKQAGIAVPDIDALRSLSNALVGSDPLDLIELFQQFSNFFTLGRPVVGVPEFPEYAKEIERHELFRHIKEIVTFLHCTHTSFRPNHAEIQPLAVDLVSSTAALADNFGGGFNLLLPSTIGVDIKGGQGSSRLIKLGEGRSRIKVSLWRPLSFNHLPRTMSGPDGAQYTVFDLILKPPNSSKPHRGTFSISYR